VLSETAVLKRPWPSQNTPSRCLAKPTSASKFEQPDQYTSPPRLRPAGKARLAGGWLNATPESEPASAPTPLRPDRCSPIPSGKPAHGPCAQNYGDHRCDRPGPALRGRRCCSPMAGTPSGCRGERRDRARNRSRRTGPTPTSPRMAGPQLAAPRSLVDWDREVPPATPTINRWTQWLVSFSSSEAGPGLRKEARSTGIPDRSTVLANEQVE